MAAEAYVTFIIDGGALRVYYPGLKAALGTTIGQAREVDGFIVPQTEDFEHVRMGDIDV